MANKGGLIFLGLGAAALIGMAINKDKKSGPSTTTRNPNTGPKQVRGNDQYHDYSGPSDGPSEGSHDYGAQASNETPSPNPFSAIAPEQRGGGSLPHPVRGGTTTGPNLGGQIIHDGGKRREA